MGFFKSMNELSKQGKEMQKNMDVGQMMGDAQQKMAEANQMMAAQTAAANLSMTGKDATATINNAAQTGAMVNMQPTLAFDLTVFPEGGVPYPAQVTQVVEQVYLSKAAAGQTVKLKIDQNDPNTIWIDWQNSLTL
jgi:hypothetical protein